MLLENQPHIGRCATRERRDRPFDRLAQMREGRIRQDRLIGLQLQRHHDIGGAARPQRFRRRHRLPFQPIAAPRMRRAHGMFEQRVDRSARPKERSQRAQHRVHAVIQQLARHFRCHIVPVPHFQIRHLQSLGPRSDGLGIVGQAGVSAHAVALQRQPIRPQIAVLHHPEPDARRGGEFLRHDVIGYKLWRCIFIMNKLINCVNAETNDKSLSQR